jgi:Rrf2 family transcriptional regulator, iron-sulfur cluster assembly transcription factor
MKINAIDEYGLRILIRLGKEDAPEGLSISQLSELEGLSQAYVAKLTRLLKSGGLIHSTRGHKGGYVLATDPQNITVSTILKVLGGSLFDASFCQGHSGVKKFCTNSVDCSVRSLWKMVQKNMDNLLNQVSLADLVSNESHTMIKMQRIFEQLHTPNADIESIERKEVINL